MPQPMPGANKTSGNDHSAGPDACVDFLVTKCKGGAARERSATGDAFAAQGQQELFGESQSPGIPQVAHHAFQKRFSSHGSFDDVFLSPRRLGARCHRKLHLRVKSPHLNRMFARERIGRNTILGGEDASNVGPTARMLGPAEGKAHRACICTPIVATRSGPQRDSSSG
jgi:hypothetical protein